MLFSDPERPGDPAVHETHSLRLQPRASGLEGGVCVLHHLIQGFTDRKLPLLLLKWNALYKSHLLITRQGPGEQTHEVQCSGRKACEEWRN